MLVDSRLAHKFALTGAMALRARWGSGRARASCWRSAGFNPRFAPPADLPQLERIAIALASGNNPRLTCEAYFAITSNTVQFGARAQLYAAAYGFSVEGDVGFDVLIQIAPLHFIADFHASVQLKRGSQQPVQGVGGGRARRAAAAARQRQGVVRDLLVRLLGALRQDAGHGEKPPLPPAVDRARASCSRRWRAPASWSTQHRASSARRGAAQACRRRATRCWCSIRSGKLVVQAAGRCRSTPRATSTLFGGAPVAGARRFQLGAALEGAAAGRRSRSRDRSRRRSSSR